MPVVTVLGDYIRQQTRDEDMRRLRAEGGISREGKVTPRKKDGRKNWARQAAEPKDRGRRDVMTAAQRSACMARIRGKDTGPERFVLGLLTTAGVNPETHARDLPGRPDFVLRDRRVAIFVDGDFWHGWRFPTWRHKLAPFWETKIAANRQRDGRNHSRLRRAGWHVIRIWEHQIEQRPDHVRRRIADAVSVAVVHS